MKARIKFRKFGAMKFIGHLDIMRFFQKVMRRADIPIAFTGGYSPHMIMSFANPLGVGLTSDGEYFDIELTEELDMQAAVNRMNAVSVEGIEIVNMVPISDDKKRTGMSIVAAADYLSGLKKGSFPKDWKEKAEDFLTQEEIKIVKKTKKSEKEVDIKPLIYRFELRGEDVYMQLATGSVENLKPEVVMCALCQYLGVDTERVAFWHHRLDVYAEIGEKEFASLDKVW
ncbi:MAG: TIGR03936 family radical SAM-associated protein [Faecalimonas sp.]|nr:TIGR03936 family radical SAM-associated protein [Faecalimonas sp.]